MTKEHATMKIERTEIFEPHPKKILKSLTEAHIKPFDPVHYEFGETFEKDSQALVCVSDLKEKSNKTNFLEEKYDHQETCDSTVSDPTDSDDSSTTSSLYRKRKREPFNDTDEEIDFLIKRQKQEETVCMNIFQKFWESIVDFFHNLFF